MKILVAVFLISVVQTVSGNNPETKANLNTAAKANYLSPTEKEIIYELNLFRSNPAKYANDYIAPLANNYKGKILSFPGQQSIMTQEGIKALNECVSELKRAQQLPLLYPNSGLSKAASDHVSDQS